jgi:uncharacterized membrane protein (UPF0127 family)
MNKMKSGYVYINDNLFETLIALSDIEQRKGLMGEKWKPPIMSFVYDKPKINKFWMYNTPSPLDIVFCKNGKITQIHHGEPYSIKSIGNDEYSDLIVELPLGTIYDINAKISDSIGLVNPSIKDLFK